MVTDFKIKKVSWFQFEIVIIVLLVIIPMYQAITPNITDKSDSPKPSFILAGQASNLNTTPIELTELRSYNSKTFDCDDGKLKTEIHIKPIHYFDSGGAWEEIDFKKNLQNPISRSSSRNIKTLQPGPSTGKDSFISTSFGYEENEIMNNGEDTEIFLSHDVDSVDGFYPFRGLIRFDIDSLSLPIDTEIIHAQLELHYYSSTNTNQDKDGEDSQITLSAYPITRAWEEGTGFWQSNTKEGVTWEKFNNTDYWANEGGDYYLDYLGVGETPESYGWTYINITKMAAGWVSASLPNHGLILIGDTYNVYLKKFKSSDSLIVDERPKLVIDYIPNKRPAIINNINTVELTEDGASKYIHLDGKAEPESGIFKDPNVNDVLKFYINDENGSTWHPAEASKGYSSQFITANIKINNTVEINPKPDKFGTDEITLKAVDNKDAFTIYYLKVKLNPVNDPPILNDVTKWEKNQNNPNKDSTIFSEDGCSVRCTQDLLVDINATAIDIDTEHLTFVIGSYEIKNSYLDNSTFENNFIIDSRNGNIRFTPTNKWVGSFVVNVSVSDGLFSDFKNFTFIVVNVNDEPVISRVNDNYVNNHEVFMTGPKQDETYNFTIYAIDLDNNIGLKQILQFSAHSEHVKINKLNYIGHSAFNFSFTPGNSDALRGYVLVYATVMDHAGLDHDDWVMINFSVIFKNYPPEIISINGVIPPVNKFKHMGEISIGDYGNVTLLVSDRDNDDLTCVVNGTQIFSILLDGKWYLSYLPKSSEIGTQVVNITFIENTIYGLRDWIELEWVVLSGEPPNEPPIITLTTNEFKARVGDEFTIKGKLIDDGKPLGGLLEVKITIYNSSTDLVLLPETSATILRSSSFTYSFKIPDNINKKSTIGNWTIELWVTDGEKNSPVYTANLIIAESSDESAPLLFGVGVNGLIIILLFIILIISLFIFTSVKRKKKRAIQTSIVDADRILAPKSKGTKYVLTVDIKCLACGAIIPAYSSNCKKCGRSAELMYNPNQPASIMQPISMAPTQTDTSASTFGTVSPRMFKNLEHYRSPHDLSQPQTPPKPKPSPHSKPPPNILNDQSPSSQPIIVPSKGNGISEKITLPKNLELPALPKSKSDETNK